ncbi:MAG: DNA polymerase II large subunit [Candidatus Geothermarchaeales archaeon]
MRGGERKYFLDILNKASKEYDFAAEARNKNIDPEAVPECAFTWDMAERVERLVGPKGVAEYIRRHEGTLDRERLALRVVDAIIDGEFGVHSVEETADQAVRTALAILTEGVTVSPSQGISRVTVRRDPRGASYLSVYFAGPIRSAGGTELGLILVYADYIRRRLGLGRYQPLVTSVENEINRFIEELRLHEREIGQFQFRVSNRQIETALRHLPVEINGVGTGRIEVLVNKDMSRIETNLVRGGALRVLNDGIIGRSRKILYVVSELGIEGWLWLSELASLSPRGDEPPNDRAVFESIAGRPIFSLPNEAGGFRLRYGRAANTGLSAVGLHPATFAILDYFLVPGTQIKVDFPGKGAVVMPVSSISPPVVKLMDGSITTVESEEMAIGLSSQISKVLWLGDMLISFGDFLENRHPLRPSAYVDEWWRREFVDALESTDLATEKIIPKLNLTRKRLNEILSGQRPSFEEAMRLSKVLGIPLHPRHLFRWGTINISQLLSFLSFLKENVGGGVEEPLTLPIERPILTVFESVLIPFSMSDGKIVVTGEAANFLRFLTSIEKPFSKDAIDRAEGSPLKLLSWYIGVELRDVIGSTIASRMARPEKAARREMKPVVHVLFPVGNYGGPSRDLVKASQEREKITIEIAFRKCIKCDRATFYVFCPICGEKTSPLYFCRKCNTSIGEKRCTTCGSTAISFRKTLVNLKSILDSAKKSLKIRPDMVKGVRGLTNRMKLPERVEKGLIRSAHDISVFKDGTARFDVTNAPLTSFHPKDVNLTPEKARELGYKSVTGDETLYLKPQDIIIPRVAADYLLTVTRFIDDLLMKVYGLQSFYNAASIEDLIGVLVVGLSPHTSVGVLGRIIGFTSSQVLYAHPLWHAAKRRDCDGDQDSIMLLLDVLINFSRHYLPATMGGEMDAPLFVNPVILPSEVDSQAHNIEVSSFYPREFYEATLSNSLPQEAAKFVKWVNERLNTKDQYGGIPSIFPGPHLQLKENRSSYRRLHAMSEKIRVQVELSSKLSSVDVYEMVRSVVKTHLLPDLIGNLRAFTTQTFRCKSCYAIHRRPPLSGRCDSCGGDLIQTVHRKSVEKYLDIVKDLLRNFCPDPYLQERVALLEREIDLTISEAGKTQKKLSEFM